MIPVVIDALGIILKVLEKGLEDLKSVGRVETIQIGRNTEKSWRLEETCCHSDSIERPSAYAGVKNSLVII